MGRILDDNVKNELKILDPVSGSVIKFYYRLPTSEERIKYGSEGIEIIDGKVIVNSIKPRQKWGPEILTGFEDGSFHIVGKDISSDPGSSNFEPNWKDILKEKAMDLLEALSEHVFEGRRIIPFQEVFTEKN